MKKYNKQKGVQNMQPKFPVKFEKTSGYDANGHRITNIVGFDGVELLKECPRCGLAKKSSAFGVSGRKMEQDNEKSIRDQSYCIECR
jgi:hypothetical protein